MINININIKMNKNKNKTNKIDVETFFNKHKLNGFMIAPTAIINGLG